MVAAPELLGADPLGTPASQHVHNASLPEVPPAGRRVVVERGDLEDSLRE